MTINPEVINGMTFEMAQTKVQGTKYKAFHKFKVYATPSFGFEDIKSEIDLAIVRAWKEWNPSESKFNTFATNMINWLMYRSLENCVTYFKINHRTKQNLHNHGESFKTLSKKKVTTDTEFNEKHKLDGEKKFTRDLFNQYVYHITSNVYGLIGSSFTKQSEYISCNGETVDVLSQYADENIKVALAEMEFESDLAKIDETVIKVYQLLRQGFTLKHSIKETKTTLYRLKNKILNSDSDLAIKYATV